MTYYDLRKWDGYKYVALQTHTTKQHKLEKDRIETEGTLPYVDIVLYQSLNLV
jgi:hypothetical protein